jgi:hypothetical protein
VATAQGASGEKPGDDGRLAAKESLLLVVRGAGRGDGFPPSNLTGFLRRDGRRSGEPTPDGETQAADRRQTFFWLALDRPTGSPGKEAKEAGLRVAETGGGGAAVRCGYR